MSDQKGYLKSIIEEDMNKVEFPDGDKLWDGINNAGKFSKSKERISFFNSKFLYAAILAIALMAAPVLSYLTNGSPENTILINIPDDKIPEGSINALSISDLGETVRIEGLTPELGAKLDKTDNNIVHIYSKENGKVICSITVNKRGKTPADLKVIVENGEVVSYSFKN